MNRVKYASLLILLAACQASGGSPSAQRVPPGWVIAWGMNFMGSTNPSGQGLYFKGPLEADGHLLTNAVQISAGGSHALVLLSDGTVAGIGFNMFGAAIGHDTPDHMARGLVVIGGHPLSNIVSVAAGRRNSQSFSVALRNDGSLVAWGVEMFGLSSPPPLSGVSAISAGEDQALALLRNGTVRMWGQGTPPPMGLSNVVAISATGGGGRNLALRADASVFDWPALSVDATSTVPVGLSNAVAISAGFGHSLALRTDGTILGWGANRFGQATGTPSPEFPHMSTGAVAIAGQVLSNIVAVAAAAEYSLALSKKGTVIAWGEDKSRQTEVPARLDGVVAISASMGYSLAITTNLSWFRRR